MIRKLLFLGTLTIAFSLLASVASAQLKLTGAEPGSSAPGTDITLHGSGFDATAGDNTVTFTPAGGAAGTNVIPTAIVGTTLRVTVPAGLSGGQFELSVTRASDGASTTLATLFAVLTGNTDAEFTPLAAGLNGVGYGSSDWGDFDGDGDLDLVSTGYGSNPTATIYRNDGAGGFVALAAGLTGVYQGSSDWGDFDGDGDLDLVITGYDGSNRTATIYRNDGVGGFVALAAGLPGVIDGTSDWVDFDGDGDLDLVITGLDGSANTTATIYENDGADGFVALSAGLTGVQRGSSDWGDFDGDGDLDLVMTGYDGSNRTATIYRNDGSGGFVTLAAGLTEVIDGTSDWVDIDGDGDLDLVITGLDDDVNRTATIYENDGTGGFAALPAGLTGVYRSSSDWGDIDGDGDLDVVITGLDGAANPTATIYENDGAGGFAALAAGLTGVQRGSSDWGDFDGDGDLDLVITGYDDSNNQTATIYKNVADPTFVSSTPASNANNVAITSDITLTFDQNVDGTTATAGNINVQSKQDGLVGGSFSVSGHSVTFNPTAEFRNGDRITVTVTTGLTNTDGLALNAPHTVEFSTKTAPAPETPPVFSAGDITTTADGAVSVYSADVDGDGDMDLLSASQHDDTIAWYENNGSLSFTKHIVTTTADGAQSVIAADFDGDGDLDIASASSADDKIAWYENTGGGSFGIQQIVSSSAYDVQSVVAADLDGDGDMDLASASANYNRILWHENEGGGSFGSDQVISKAHTPRSVVAADLDGDGDLDIASASSTDDKIAWYENIGGGSFKWVHTVTTSADGAQSVVAVDVDGDGDLDLLSASLDDDTIAWYENDGAQNFTKHVVTTAADGARSVHVADVDGDGDMDLISASTNDNTIAWYENDGSQSFTQRIVTSEAGGAGDVHAADMDGDGDLDLISASSDDDAIDWYENVLAAPLLSDVSPAENSTAVSINTAVSIDYDRTILVSDLSGISIKDTEGTVVNNIVANLDGDSTLLISHDAFLKGTTYTVIVPAGAVSNTDDIATTTEQTWSFTTIIAEPDQVVLSVPAEGATGISRQPSLEWGAASRAVAYRLQLSAVSDFSTTIIDVSNITQTDHAVTDVLDLDTEYYWRVRASNEGGTGDWSTTESFTTATENLETGPSGGATDVALEPTLMWETISWATDYRVQVSTEADFSTTLVNQSDITETSYTVSQELSSSTTYYWRFRASSTEETGDWSEANSFTTVPAAPEAVVLDGPSNEAEGLSILPDFSWNSSEGADDYTVELSTDNTFGEILLDSTLSATGFVPAESLQKETTYYWRVKASNSGGESEWSAVRSFTTIVEVPDAVTLNSPGDGSSGVPIAPSLTWGSSVGSDSYQLQVSAGMDFSETVFDKTAIADTVFTVTIDLAHLTQYRWRVRGINEGGEGAWSDPRSFTTITDKIDVQAAWSFSGVAGPEDFRLVALPGQVDESLQAVFTGSAGIDWQAFWDNGADENYLEMYDGSDSFNMAPGNGFWITAKESVEYNNQIPMVAMNSRSETTIPLHEGWNIISNPLDINVAWSEIQSANENTLQPIWGFEGLFAESGVFKSAKEGEAFYFLNDQGLDELVIPYKEGSPKAKPGTEGEQEIRLITLENKKETSSSRIIFVAPDQKLPPDVVAPPGGFEQGSVRIAADTVKQKSKRRGSLARIYRELKAEGQSFDLILSVSPEEPVTVRIEGWSSALSSELVLIDKETGRKFDLKDHAETLFALQNEKANLLLVIGDAAFVEQEQRKFLPKQFNVLPNYPNPFYPTTTIQFDLPVESEVRLQIFDILGRRISTLLDGVHEPGIHRVIFDGGRSASGMYFAVFDIEDKRFVQKLMLIK